MNLPSQLFLNGLFRDASSGQRSALINPATEEAFVEVAAAEHARPARSNSQGRQAKAASKRTAAAGPKRQGGGKQPRSRTKKGNWRKKRSDAGKRHKR